MDTSDPPVCNCTHPYTGNDCSFNGYEEEAANEEEESDYIIYTTVSVAVVAIIAVTIIVIMQRKKSKEDAAFEKQLDLIRDNSRDASSSRTA